MKKAFAPKFIFYICIVALASVLPLIFSSKYVMHLLTTFMISIVSYLGLNLLIGLSGQVSLGHSAFFGIGAYTAGLMCTKLGTPAWITIILGTVFSIIIGALLGLPAARLKGPYLTMTTLAFTQLFILLMTNLTDFSNGPIGVINIGPLKLFGIAFDTKYKMYLLTLAFALLAIFVFTRIKNGPIGRSWRAMGNSRIAAEAMGINPVRYNVLAFAICSGFAGLAGTLYAYYNTYISPDQFNLSLSFSMVQVLVIGGRGSVLGTIIGAFIQTFVPEWLRPLGDWRYVIFSVLLILIVIFAPAGCVGLLNKLKSSIIGHRKIEQSHNEEGKV
ncbi:MAG: branched-chain amino acid ABC transporter permease [Oscillospiraceae bacterium]|nr:branched-chain amino acid ABC transporter permease [Oscillospiraceae bacterium]